VKLARLCVAAFCSETGEWMMQIALPILVYQATGSVASTAAMMIVGLVPAVLLSPVAGVLADRVDRRLLLLGVCLGQLLVAAPLLLDPGTSWLVMAGQASLAAFFEPARNALVPEVSDSINAANGFLAAGANVARLVGAWLGGVLFAVGGVEAVYFGYAGVLIIASGALVPRLGSKPLPSKRSPVRDWLDGLAIFRRVWTVGVVLALMSVSQGMFLVLFVPFVLDTLTTSPRRLGSAARGRPVTLVRSQARSRPAPAGSAYSVACRRSAVWPPASRSPRSPGNSRPNACSAGAPCASVCCPP
jgi:MFS family permease